MMKRVAGFLLLLAFLLGPHIGYAQQLLLPSQHTLPGSMEGSHVFQGSTITSLSVTWHTSAARWLMVFDATSVPGNGAVGAASPLVFCQYVQGASGATDGTQNYDFTTHPLKNFTGVAVVLSTSASGCSSLTADGANDWFAGQVQ